MSRMLTGTLEQDHSETRAVMPARELCPAHTHTQAPADGFRACRGNKLERHLLADLLVHMMRVPEAELAPPLPMP